MNKVLTSIPVWFCRNLQFINFFLMLYMLTVLYRQHEEINVIKHSVEHISDKFRETDPYKCRLKAVEDEFDDALLDIEDYAWEIRNKLNSAQYQLDKETEKEKK